MWSANYQIDPLRLNEGHDQPPLMGECLRDTQIEGFGPSTQRASGRVWHRPAEYAVRGAGCAELFSWSVVTALEVVIEMTFKMGYRAPRTAYQAPNADNQ